MARRRLDRDAVKLAYLESRAAGRTVKAAAAAAGVHVATVCRWRAADPAFDALAREVDAGVLERLLAEAELRAVPLDERVFAAMPRRPVVAWHPDCPRCAAPAEVRRGGRWPAPTFWRCTRYPQCKWASWLPRH